MSLGVVHRPRDVDWSRSAALLYGDWGTSKAYVIGLGFVAAGFQSLPIIIAVCLLTALVGYNYIVICKHFPEGGGVYSAARGTSRSLAVIGALMLVANFGVTAALSGWAAMSYFDVPAAWIPWATMGLVVGVGGANWFGARHSGNLALWLALPMLLVVGAILILAVPHLSSEVSFAWPEGGFRKNWINFVAVILALSGVEAVANLTGVMKLDPGSTPANPKVSRTAHKSILPVTTEVVIATILLGWAMLSLPAALGKSPESIEPMLLENYEKIIRVLGEQYGTISVGAEFGVTFGMVTGIVVGLLLVSAVNTAVSALVGLIYMLAKDGEMPKRCANLNRHGVPILPLAVAVVMPLFVVGLAAFTGKQDEAFKILASLYAIGVVGAIAINLGVCSFNSNLQLRGYERGIMLLTFAILLGAWLTIAYEPTVDWKPKGHALFFIVVVLGSGMLARSISQKHSGLRTVTVRNEIAEAIEPETQKAIRLNLEEGHAVLVASQRVSAAAVFALEEARLRKGTLFVLFVHEVNVALPGKLEFTERPKWEDDPEAARLMTTMLTEGVKHEVKILPLYVHAENVGSVIVDMAATYGIDTVVLGHSKRGTVSGWLHQSVTRKVNTELPKGIRLISYSA